MSSRCRCIAVVGSVNRDTILTADGVRTESYGGMLYSILALAAIADVTIYPICNLGADVEGPVRAMLGDQDSVRWDGIRVVTDQNPHCVLDYDSAGHKQETLYGGVPALPVERILPFLDCDALCLNFITGQELALPVLRDVKARAGRPVFMDFHSLSLASDSGGKRYLRCPPDWEAWAAAADFVQMNDTEAGLLAEVTHVDEQTALRLGDRILSLGPRAVAITRGREGSWTVRRDRKGGTQISTCRLDPPGPAIDETGCGDVFLMGFTWAYLINGDIDGAIRYANRVAGANCCLRGIEEVGRVGDLIPAAERIDPAKQMTR